MAHSKQIIEKYFSQNVSKKVRSLFADWFYVPVDEDLKDQILQDQWEKEYYLSPGEVEKSYEAVIKRISSTGKSKSRKFRPIFWASATSAVAAIVVAVAILATPSKTDGSVHVSQERYAEMTECYVSNGEKQMITLDDSTSVILNSGSLLIYPKEFHGTKREVYLTGEAIFDVSKDPQHPFVVKTPDFSVKVQGSSNPVGGEELKVISYNIRVGKGKDGSNSWEYRRPASISMLKEQMPDIFGLQEALDFQVDYLQDNLPGYANVGVGRDDGVAKGERMAIFYNTERVELLEWGTYWLSETPDVPSKGWDAAYPRCATWSKMRLRDSGKEFFYVNTHLDHQGTESQRKGLDMIVNKIAQMNPDGLPMVLTGDFNVEPENPVLDELDSRMLSARTSALDANDKATFNGWGSRAIIIDYIYHSGFSHCPEYDVLDSSYDSVPYISDHYPVMSRLKF